MASTQQIAEIATVAGDIARQKLATLQQWVEINSYSYHPQGLDAMTQRLAKDMQTLGLSVETKPNKTGGAHLVGTSQAFGRQRNGILLVGHHDTVFPPGTFEGWTCTADRIQGPGVLDMKGGLFVVFCVLEALKKHDVLDTIPLAFVSVADEEIGSADSSSLWQDIASFAKCGLVFEGGRGEDQIITDRKGTGRMTISVTGKAAHAGNHHQQGINAITSAARIVVLLEKLTDYENGVTVNVGRITGGTSANTVPNIATIDVDFRFVAAKAGTVVTKQINDIAKQISALDGTEVCCEGGVRRQPLTATPASLELWQRYAEEARAAGLGATRCDLVGGGSDANLVCQYNVPCIDGLGPRGKGFHTSEEYIITKTIAMRAEALARFLAKELS